LAIIIDLSASHASAAISDLRKVCPDPGLTVNMTTGEISYTQMIPFTGPGCELVKELVPLSCKVYVRGVDTKAVGPITVFPTGAHLHKLGYTAPLGSIGSAMEVVYDTTDCGGTGSWFLASPSTWVPGAPDVFLFHELTHGLRACKLVDPWSVHDYPKSKFAAAWDKVEEEARSAENGYRQSRSPPLPPRLVSSALADYAGCNPPPLGSLPAGSSPPPPRSPETDDNEAGQCFVATAAYGSALEPEVELLRRIRDDVLRRTRAGAEFFEDFYEPYYRVSPAIVELMRSDPRVMEVVRWAIVHPIVAHLEQALRFPDAPLDDVPEPWRSFLLKTRRGLERWGQAIELPDDFESLGAEVAGRELEIVLRYLCRTPESRASYLERLTERGALPLEGCACELRQVAGRLRRSGRQESEIELIVGERPRAPTRERQSA